MVDRILDYTEVFCGEAVLFMEEDINEELQRLTSTIKELETHMTQWEPCTKGDLIELERKINNITPTPEPEAIEPLWVRNQQKKTFKRGKK